MDNLNAIKSLLDDSVNAKKAFLENEGNITAINEAASIVLASLKSGGKVLTFGNGGSAADSQHLAAELVVRFEEEREALPCISLNVNVSTLTAASNDYSFEDIFSRQVEALGAKDDTVVAISTSGNSPNVLKGVKAAKEKGLKVISLTGKDGGKLAPLSDIPIVVKSDTTARIQEVHITIIHIICKLVEEAFKK